MRCSFSLYQQHRLSCRRQFLDYVGSLMLRTPMDEMKNKTFVLIAQLAGDKEDRDNKLRRMSDELKKLKDKLARQERMEDEVCFNIS